MMRRRLCLLVFGALLCLQVSAAPVIYGGGERLFLDERDFEAIAVVGGRAGEEITGLFPPCGVCRQVMREFCEDDFEIILYDGRKQLRKTLAEILPFSFSRADLES